MRKERDWVTPQELADREGVQRRTVYFWIHQGVQGVKLAVRVVGGLYRIYLRDFDEFGNTVARRRGLAPQPSFRATSAAD